MFNKLVKKSKKVGFIILSCVALVACGSDSEKEGNVAEESKKENESKEEKELPEILGEISAVISSDEITPQITEEITPQETATVIPKVEQKKKYHVTVYDNLFKGTKVELDITEGDLVNPDKFTELLGYDFVGCYDKNNADGELYIDKDGRVCAEIVSDMELYAWYEAKNYTLSFICNGKEASTYGVQNMNVAYDADMRDFLPLGKIINENELIYSVSYENMKLADILDTQKVYLNEATLKDNQVFMNDNKIIMNIDTVIISQLTHCGAQEVCIKDDYDQFEQRFKDEYICDSLSLEKFDFDLLERLGYNTAVIEISSCIREKDDGEQEIYVYHMKYENNAVDNKKAKKSKKKEMEDYLLKEYTYDCCCPAN